MHKVITGTVFAVAAMATTAAFAEGTKAASTAQPTAIERLWSDVTGSGVSAKNATTYSNLSASDQVRLNGYAPTGKPELDEWVRQLRSFRTDGPAGN